MATTEDQCLTITLRRDLADSSIKVGARKCDTLPVSVAVHTGDHRAYLVPLMAADVLPIPPSLITFVRPCRPRRRPRRHRLVGPSSNR